MLSIPMLIDTHCHLDFPLFDLTRQAILERARSVGVHQYWIPAIRAADFERVQRIAHQYNQPYALGLHPLFIQEHTEESRAMLKSALECAPPFALGEIGLDHHAPDRDAQESLFKQQLQWARHYELPVLIHARKAHDTLLSLLKTFPVKTGVIHGFNGSVELAQAYVKKGMVLGIGGILSYPTAHRLTKVVQTLPLTAFVLETDAPDMPLWNHAGQPNEPAAIRTLFELFVQLRSESSEECAAHLLANGKRILNRAPSP